MPDITIYVRHSAGCKYEGDESARRCNCRKWLRWTHDGKRHREMAGTRSWAEAEGKKREIEDQLLGRVPEAGVAKNLRQAVDVFLQDKRVQGVAADTLATYTRELNRLVDYAERSHVFTVQALSREILSGYAVTWEGQYPSSVTRSHVRERCRTFLRFCYETQWLPRIPALPKIKVDAVPTLPLTSEEFAALLAAIPKGLPHAQAARKRVRVRGLFLLMRHSGLAIRDALSLRRSDLRPDPKGFYRVVTQRQKTGTDVSVPIPKAIGDEVLAVPNGNPEFIFWTGVSKGDNHTTKWQTRYIAPVFKAAGLYGDARMVSHRLRDTFAVDLLEKGVPLEEVSKLLGHESIKTTERHYAKWVQGRQDRLDTLVIGTWV